MGNSVAVSIRVQYLGSVEKNQRQQCDDEFDISRYFDGLKYFGDYGR